MANIIDRILNRKEKLPIRVEIAGGQSEIQNLKAQSVPTKLLQYVQHTVDTPKFALYWDYYQGFPDVSTPVNRIARRVASLGGQFVDKDGYPLPEIDKDLNSKIKIRELIEEFSIHMLVYGQAIPAMFKAKNQTYLKLIPSHEVTFWLAQMFAIEELRWQWEYQILDVKSDFAIYKFPSINSKFFGKSPLNSFYDDLNSLHLDIQNINLFLENNSFSGLVIYPKENITEEDKNTLKQYLVALSKPKNRFRAGLVEGVEKMEQLKQEYLHKLTIEEKRDVAVKAASAVGYPYAFLKESTTGLGQGEQKSVLLTYRDETIVPLQTIVAEFINNFVVPRYLGEVEVKWEPTDMQVESVTELATMGIDGFNAGIFSAYEVKTRFLGYKESEVQEDDKFRKLKNSDVIVKEGEAQEGNLSQGEGLDEVDENISDNNPTPENLKKNFNLDTLKSYLDNVKDINANDKRRIHKFFAATQNLKEESFSKIPELIKGQQHQDFKKVIENGLQKQIDGINLQNLVNKFQKSNKKSEKTDLAAEIRQYLDNFMPTFADSVDVEELAFYLQYMANVGKNEAIQAIIEFGDEVSDKERGELNAAIREHVEGRTASLFGLNNAENNQLDDPRIPQGLDDSALDEYSLLIAGLLLTGSTLEQIKAALNKRILERAQLISETETGRLYNYGYYITGGDKYDNEWLRTKSADPREIHLALVGTRRPAGRSFNGEWPGVRPNCKCSLKKVKK